MVSVTVRELALDEISSIGGIDSSEIVNAIYVCMQDNDGMGLRLQRQVVQPPRQQPTWGERELAGRYELWHRNVHEEGAVFHGAFMGDRLVGISLVTRLSDGKTAELYAMHVNRAHRRQGIGSALLQQVEAQCRAWACRQLILYTGFNAGAVDFYRAHGFSVVGIQDPKVRTKNFDLTMVKDLK